MNRRLRRGFTLIEVLAAFVVALVLIAPLVNMISGVAGSMAGLDRSTQRRADLQMASVVAASTDLVPGRHVAGEFSVEVSPYPFAARADLDSTGWRLYSVAVSKADGHAAGLILETVRMGRR